MSYSIKQKEIMYDESEKCVRVTLWNKFDDKILKENQIVALKNFRVSEFNGLQLNSTFDSSLITDFNDPRVQKLQNWQRYKITFRLRLHPPVLPSTPKSISQKTEAHLNLGEILKTGYKNQIDESGRLYSVRGIIQKLVYDQAFYYYPCKSCHKKASSARCEACGGETDSTPLYHFHIKINDGTGGLWVPVFGEAGERIMGGVSALDLVRLHKAGCADNQLSAPINQQFVLQLKLRKEQFGGKIVIKAILTKIKDESFGVENILLLSKLREYCRRFSPNFLN